MTGFPFRLRVVSSANLDRGSKSFIPYILLLESDSLVIVKNIS